MAQMYDVAVIFKNKFQEKRKPLKKRKAAKAASQICQPMVTRK